MCEHGGYAAFPDPYCYTGTNVLKNIPDIRDQPDLDRFETAITAQRAQEPMPTGRYSVTHYRAIHRHLFQDVYRWAGRFRTVRIAKDGSTFCYPEYISGEMRSLFDLLRIRNFLRELNPKDFATQMANFLSELNAIHPFRDGNGRSQLVFVAILSQQAGYPLVLQRLHGETFLPAMIEGFRGNEEPLSQELARLIE